MRALLAYLAVENDRPQRRETLAGLLWPDMAERDARTNLRHVLANLRKVLGDREADQSFPSSTARPSSSTPQVTVQLDVNAFTDAIAATSTHAHASLEDVRVVHGTFAGSCELYQGEFLAGFSLPSDLFEVMDGGAAGEAAHPGSRCAGSPGSNTRKKGITMLRSDMRNARWNWNRGGRARTGS